MKAKLLTLFTIVSMIGISNTLLANFDYSSEEIKSVTKCRGIETQAGAKIKYCFYKGETRKSRSKIDETSSSITAYSSRYSSLHDEKISSIGISVPICGREFPNIEYTGYNGRKMAKSDCASLREGVLTEKGVQPKGGNQHFEESEEETEQTTYEPVYTPSYPSYPGSSDGDSPSSSNRECSTTITDQILRLRMLCTGMGGTVGNCSAGPNNIWTCQCNCNP